MSELDRLMEDSEEFIWTTKDGEEIPFSKLTDQHLLNIERMMSRLLSDMWGGYYPQGEHAQDAYWGGLNKMEYEHGLILDEVKKRGLKVL